MTIPAMLTLVSFNFRYYIFMYCTAKLLYFLCFVFFGLFSVPNVIFICEFAMLKIRTPTKRDHGRVKQPCSHLTSVQFNPLPLALIVVPPTGQSIILCSEIKSVEFLLLFETDPHRFSLDCANEIPAMEFLRITDQRTYTPP